MFQPHGQVHLDYLLRHTSALGHPGSLAHRACRYLIDLLPRAGVTRDYLICAWDTRVGAGCDRGFWVSLQLRQAWTWCRHKTKNSNHIFKFPTFLNYFEILTNQFIRHLEKNHFYTLQLFEINCRILHFSALILPSFFLQWLPHRN